MFGFFNPKQTKPILTDILRLDNAAYVLAVKRMLETGTPAAWAMCAIAYQNLEPFLMACAELSKERTSSNIPADLDSLIRSLSSRIEQISEEIPRRRLAWFFQAALIRRATDIASRNNNLQQNIAAIWIMLARGCALLHEILKYNTLWSEDEKKYFDVIKNEKEGIRYCLHILTPAYLRKSDYLTAFAQSQDVLLLPW